MLLSKLKAFSAFSSLRPCILFILPLGALLLGGCAWLLMDFVEVEEYEAPTLAPVILELRLCGEFEDQRIQLLQGLMMALLLGAQTIVPDMTVEMADQEQGPALYDMVNSSGLLQRVYRDFWCQPQRSSHPGAFWCAASQPSMLNTSMATSAYRRMPATRRPCPLEVFRADSMSRFAENMWKFWRESDGSNRSDPSNVQVAMCGCRFSKGLQFSDTEETWAYFWKVEDALRFDPAFMVLVREAQSQLVSHAKLADKKAAALGYPRSAARSSFHVLLLRSDEDWLSFCTRWSNPKKLRSNCLNNTWEIGNLMLAEGVDPRLPVYLVMPVNVSESEEAPMARKALQIYSLVTQEMLRSPLGAKPLAFGLAMSAEMFLGNSLDRFSSFVMLSRHRRNLRSVNYNGGGAFLEDGVVQVGVRRVIGPTFRLPIKWIFTVDRRMEGLFPQGEQLMRIKVAIRSAITSTSLTPVCVTSADIGSPLAQWLLKLGARVIYHRPAWHSLVASWNCADSLMDSFLRIDIPVLGFNDEFVLYSSSDVIFTKDVTWSGLLGDSKQAKIRMEKNDFAQGKSFFAKPREIGVPRYFAMSCGPEPMNEPLDPTVLLMNMRTMKDSYLKFRKYITHNKSKLTCTPNLNEMFKKFYRSKKDEKGTFATFLPSIFNWRPFWAPSPTAAIMNFEGFTCDGATAKAKGEWTKRLSDCNNFGACDMLCDLVGRYTS